MKKIAIFDMDRTITRTGTYTRFLIFAALRLAPWRLAFLPMLLVTMIGYPFGLVDRKTIKQIGFGLMIGERIGHDTLKSVCKAFAVTTCSTNLLPGARGQIALERADGCALIMATASPDFYAEEIGALLGFDTVIATRQSVAPDGQYLAAITGPNCYGAEKLNRITAWLDSTGIARADADIRFYSDHASDAVVLHWANRAIAVNPSRKLRHLAKANAWTILSFGSAGSGL